MPTATATPSIVERAHELRAKYPTMNARYRLQWARAEVWRAEHWGDLTFDANMTARIERDGFTIALHYGYDDCPDTSWLGEFSDTWAPGAIKNPSGWWHDYTVPNPREYLWFVPANSAEEARRWYAKAGCAKHDAWLMGQRQNRQDFERLQNITLYLLQVTVFRAGIELAVEYLGGVDLGEDYDTMQEQAVVVATDVIDGPLAEAKDALKKLAIEFAKAAEIT